MDMIDDKEIKRDKIHSLVSVYYQPSFRTFYVNTEDGINFVRPIGVFVSLGITTSKRTLDDIRMVIENHGYSAKLAEISSVKDPGTNQFLNKLINVDSPNQYLVTDYEGSTVMDKEQSMKELDNLKSLLTPEQDLDVLKEVSPRVSKLIDLINKLEPSGWDSHYIQKDGNDYRIFHRYVNYRKDDQAEYRIGIFVN